LRGSITSPQVVERIAWEVFEDSARQNIKLLEVRFSPDQPVTLPTVAPRPPLINAACLSK
jgi:adenosine deaminase